MTVKNHSSFFPQEKEMSSNTLGSTPFFTPTQISGCSLWLDATDQNTIAFSGSNVIQWNDKSGNAYNMTPFSTYSNATVSTAYQNNLNVLNFTGSNIYRSPINSAVYPLDAYIVIALKSPLTRCDVLSVTPSNVDNFNSLTFGEYTSLRWHNGSTGFFRTPNTVSPTNETSSNFLLMNWSIANNNFVIRRNATQLSQTASYTWTMSNNTFFQIGFRAATSLFGLDVVLNAYIGEIVVFNSQLATNQRQQVEGYLAWKWGLQPSLPDNHPYKTTPFNISVPPSIVSPLPQRMGKPSTSFPFFNPLSIPNCGLWFDAADTSTISANGIALTSWSNKGTLSASLTPNGTGSSTGNRSSTGLNFINVPFGGELRFTAALNNQSRSWFWVVRNNTPLANWSYMQLLYPAQAAGGQDQIYVFNSSGTSFTLFQQPFNGVLLSATVANPVNAASIFGVINSATSANNLVRTTGASATLGTSAAASGYNTSSLTYSINISNQAGYRVSLDIFEILFYQRAVTLAECLQIEGYLAWKWGLVPNLPSSHPFKNRPPGLPVVSAPLRLQMVNRGFSPLAISGCSLWLDAADTATLLLSGSNLTQWNDKSGNGYNLTQSTAIYQPFYSAKYVTLGNIRFLNIPQAALNNNAQYTIFLMFNPISPSNVIFVKQFNGTNTYNMLSMTWFFTNTGTTGVMYWYPYTGGTTVNSGSPLTTSVNQIFCLNYNGANVSMFINGNLISQTATSNNQIQNQLGATNFTLGTWFADGGFTNYIPTNQTNFQLGEMMFYGNFLNTSQRQQIEGYLAWKWGLVASLPANHPYKKWSPPPS